MLGNGPDTEEHRLQDERVLARIARRRSAWKRTVRDRPVGPTLSELELVERLFRYDFERPSDLEDLVEDVADLLEQGGLHATHPRYFGLFVPSVSGAGVAGDALAALYNPQLAARWHAPAAAHIEQQTLAFFRARVGLPESAVAYFTNGGSEANLTGVLAALAAMFPRYPEEGFVGVRPVFYASDQAHDSFLKIARAAGLGARAVRRVRSDGQQRLEIGLLDRMIAADRAHGESPFLVVATVGSTATGAIDPLTDIADLCQREGLWMHADAAWGGIALLSKHSRPCAMGIERADSVTWDAHKTLPVPMGAGMFFVRDRRHVEAVFSVHTAYVPEVASGTLDAYQQTIQWSRRFIGLKVFLTLAELGREGVERIIDGQVAMAHLLRNALLASGWKVMNRTDLPVVCFCDDGGGSSRTTALVHSVIEEGLTWISEVRLPDGQRWLRACITHAEAGPADVRALVDALERARARMTPQCTEHA